MKPDIITEVFQQSELTVQVRAAGHRLGPEPFALLKSLAGRRYERAVDLGCGSGIIPLLLSRTATAKEIWGIEIEPQDAALAEENVRLNELTGLVRIRQGHVRLAVQRLERGGFELITCNPPFFPPAADETRQSANTHELKGGLREFLAAAHHLAKKDALLAIIYHPSRLPELLAAVMAFRFSPARLFPVYPCPGRPAVFMILHAVASQQARLEIAQPLFLDDFTQLQ